MVVFTRLPSSENATFAIARPRTDALTVRPTQPEGPRSRDRPERTSTARTALVGGASAAGGATAGGSAGETAQPAPDQLLDFLLAP